MSAPGEDETSLLIEELLLPRLDGATADMAAETLMGIVQSAMGLADALGLDPTELWAERLLTDAGSAAVARKALEKAIAGRARLPS